MKSGQQTALRIHTVLRVIPTAVRHTGMSRVQVGGSCMIHARIWTQMCTALMGAHNGHKFSQSRTRVLQLLNCVSWDGITRENRNRDISHLAAHVVDVRACNTFSLNLRACLYIWHFNFSSSLDLKHCIIFYSYNSNY